MNLEEFDDTDPDREFGDGSWCECGHRKPTQGATSCTRCLFLDGNRAQAFIIATLRTAREGTLSEITQALYGCNDELTRRPALRMLRTMIRDGRVGCREEELSIFSPTSPGKHTGSTRMVYFLTAPARDRRAA